MRLNNWSLNKLIFKKIKLLVFGQFLSVAMLGFFSGSIYAAEQIKREIAVAANVKVVFFNLRGEVEFKSWKKSYISIEGELDEEASELLVKEKDGGIFIKVKLPHQLSPQQGSKLLVMLPRFATLKAYGVSTDWTLSNIGDTLIHSVSGNVELKNSKSNVNIDVVSAEVKVDTVKGDLEITSLSGKIDVSRVSGNVALSTVEGELHFKQSLIHQARLSSINGQIHVDGVLTRKGKLIANSVDGDIFLKIGNSKNLDCQFSALHGGEIKNHLKVAGKETRDYSGKYFSLTMGKGDALVEATTISGTIHLQD